LNSTSRRYRGKGTKSAMLHVNVRLPQYVVDHFKEYPGYTREIRRVLETHVKETEATQVALHQQRWQDILAEENEDE
jgi:phosphatidate phosphatase APP1